MAIEKVDTLIVGAGQAGIAMSEHLTNAGVSHLILERSRIAERWRSERWDSLVANGPAWHDRFPNMEFPNSDPDGFVPKEEIADYLVAYAAQNNAPIRTGVEVKSVQRIPGKAGYRIETSDGEFEAANVVAATGAFQRPVIPAVAPDDSNLIQIHSSSYRNPDQLPEGAVLVIGAGSSGVQIADELASLGKKVYLSVGSHDRPPRSYRRRDFVWWLGVLGMWDDEALEVGKEHVTIAVSGARGGHTVDFRRLAAQGITLVGLTESFNDDKVKFRPDLVKNIAQGDESYLSMLDAADAYADRMGLDLPLEPEARNVEPDPDCMTNPLLELDMSDAGVTSILWATGFAVDYSWLKVDVLDETGKPIHQRGVSTEPGIYFLGMPWQSRRGSPFIWGVWHDAKHLADHMATQRKYLAYQAPA
jgi:putative flavoprotein involved in K+ transport